MTGWCHELVQLQPPRCGRPLRACKQKAQQSRGRAGRPRRRRGGSYVVEVTEQTFEAETIRRSVKHPVVVELYSPRVATGQQLSDALIEIANSSGGKFLLARLNVDTAPGIVQALGAAGRADGDRPDRRAGRPAVPGRAAQGSGAGGDRPAAQGGGGQRHRRPGRAGRRRRARPTTDGGASRRPTRGSPPPTRPWPAATSPPRRPSSTSCWRPIPATPRRRSARPRPGCSPGRPASTRRSCWPAAAADASVGVQLDAADVEMVSGDVEAAFDRLIGLIKTQGRRRAQPGPGPAARAVRDRRQRRPARAQGPPGPDDRPVLGRGDRLDDRAIFARVDYGWSDREQSIAGAGSSGVAVGPSGRLRRRRPIRRPRIRAAPPRPTADVARRAPTDQPDAERARSARRDCLHGSYRLARFVGLASIGVLRHRRRAATCGRVRRRDVHPGRSRARSRSR